MLFKSLLAGCLLAVPTTAQSIPSLVVPESGASAYQFDLNQLKLEKSRWSENQDRTLNYLKSVDVNRLLYNFRANHKLSTNGAQSNGGWDAPNFPFRSHAQGHFLTSWAHCYATLKDTTCKDRATNFVAELAKCQANNGAAGFGAGYLSGFPESEFQAVEDRKLTSGNVPYYAVHKTMAGLLDVWRFTGNTQAKDVLLKMASWVNGRTQKLSTDKMQAMLGTEFGGMNDVLANIYQLTGDKQWLTVAQRFDHQSQFNPLANGQDQLNGNHANTNIPKWIGAIREYKATGTKRYLDIAKNAWDFTVNAHTYAIGANSQSEHFRPPNQISNYLTTDTAEQCNTYNMLKLTRELWTVDPSNAKYFDYYERALFNHLLGAQDSGDNHGHITYFTPLKAGGHRGIGPAWGGGTWSTDYNSFWCCQGTALETNTKLADSVYWFDNSALYVNLFTPSTLDWSQRNVKIVQTTTFPAIDSTNLTITGTGQFAIKIRIPSWTSGASISVNGQASGVEAKSGSYATISRTWASGDVITVKLPMKLYTIAANDNKNIAAIAYGPVVLSGNFGSETLNANPSLALDTVKRTSGLAFTGTSNGKTVNIIPFFDAIKVNYAVYWAISGSLPN
ncbi:hypothetical protein GQ44DRAFT_713036 [Phaeosphaeriaceae sp. PMI808]|nr:hypothetical protein GQ44DRAFT_713036 [Phaeosphaeriaceae sp. PMI808]